MRYMGSLRWVSVWPHRLPPLPLLPPLVVERVALGRYCAAVSAAAAAAAAATVPLLLPSVVAATAATTVLLVLVLLLLLLLRLLLLQAPGSINSKSSIRVLKVSAGLAEFIACVIQLAVMLSYFFFF